VVERLRVAEERLGDPVRVGLHPAGVDPDRDRPVLPQPRRELVLGLRERGPVGDLGADRRRVELARVPHGRVRVRLLGVDAALLDDELVRKRRQAAVAALVAVGRVVVAVDQVRLGERGQVVAREEPLALNVAGSR
jgi:hypothetical protein